MSEAFSPRGRGWNPPDSGVKARLRFAGPRATDLLVGVEPADTADNSSLCSTKDQSQLGSCAGFAVNQIVRGEMVRTGSVNPEFPSVLWTYELALIRQGDEGRDVGTNLGTCMDVLSEFGYPPESCMPYIVETFGKRPSPEVWRNSVDQRANGGLCYYPIVEIGSSRVRAVRQALTEGHLVAFGTQVSERFCSEQPPALVDVPGSSDAIAGGHAMVWTGFEAIAGERPRYRVVNSWGAGFGDGGFFWMSEEYLEWLPTSDLWIVRDCPHYSSEVRR
jgi:hypothetical protein